MSERALLVVDIQNDFCPGGALPVPDGDKIIPVANWIIGAFMGNNDAVIFSRDWHPQDTKEHFQKWPPHCIQTTKGAELHPNLKLPKNFMLISKGTKPDEDAYSPFEGKNYHGETLLEILKILTIKEVWIFGLALDYCVKAAALDAKKNGFDVIVIENACAAVNVNPDDGKKAVEEMRQTGIRVMMFAEFAGK